MKTVEIKNRSLYFVKTHGEAIGDPCLDPNVIFYFFENSFSHFYIRCSSKKKIRELKFWDGDIIDLIKVKQIPPCELLRIKYSPIGEIRLKKYRGDLALYRKIKRKGRGG